MKEGEEGTGNRKLCIAKEKKEGSQSYEQGCINTDASNSGIFGTEIEILDA